MTRELFVAEEEEGTEMMAKGTWRAIQMKGRRLPKVLWVLVLGTWFLGELPPESRACCTDPCDPECQGYDPCNSACINCDDGDPCTEDFCLDELGCQNWPKVCDDGNPCTDDGSCIDGACPPSGWPHCRDGCECPTDDPCWQWTCDGEGSCWPEFLCTTDQCCENTDPCQLQQCVQGTCVVTKECTSDDCCKEDPDNECTVNICNTQTWTCDPPSAACEGPGEGACCDTNECCDDGDPCTDDLCTDFRCHYITEVTVEVIPPTGSITYLGPILTQLGDLQEWNRLVNEMQGIYAEMNAMYQGALGESRDFTSEEADRIEELDSQMDTLRSQIVSLSFDSAPPVPRFFQPPEGIRIQINGPSGFSATVTKNDTLSSTASYGQEVVSAAPLGTGSLPMTITVNPTGNYGLSTLSVSWSCGNSTGGQDVPITVTGAFEEPLCLAEAGRYQGEISLATSVHAMMRDLGTAVVVLGGLCAGLGPLGLGVGAVIAATGGWMIFEAENAYSRAMSRIEQAHQARVLVIEQCPEESPVGQPEDNVCE